MGGCCSREIRKKETMRFNRSSTLIKDSTLRDIKEKYEFISLLGNGGFGKVRLYRDKECTKMKYAIKTLAKNYLDSQSIKYILEEVKTLKELDHPNIVKYFGTYEDDLFIHILMEYIPGEDLFKVISQRKFNHYTEQDAAEIINHLLKAVYFLHQQNIIHKDLKPENILFSIPGNYESVKLIDFGLSSDYLKKSRHVVGSVHYLAPEVLEAKYSFQIDSWSIGVILYVMMTGKQPFGGKTTNEIFHNIRTLNYNKTLLENHKISNEVKHLITSLLVLDENKRMKIEDALNHPWIIKYSRKYDCKVIGKGIIQSLKTFTNKNLFQKEVLYYLAKISNEDEIEKLKKFFLQIDKDNTGTIEYDEVSKAFKDLDISTDPNEIQTIWENMDFHNDGKVNYSEFLAASLSSLEEKLWTVFKSFDKTDKGYITSDSIIEVLKTNNITVNEEGLREFFEKNQKTSTRLNFEEFKLLIEKEKLIK